MTSPLFLPECKFVKDNSYKCTDNPLFDVNAVKEVFSFLEPKDVIKPYAKFILPRVVFEKWAQELIGQQAYVSAIKTAENLLKDFSYLGVFNSDRIELMLYKDPLLRDIDVVVFAIINSLERLRGNFRLEGFNHNELALREIERLHVNFRLEGLSQKKLIQQAWEIAGSDHLVYQSFTGERLESLIKMDSTLLAILWSQSDLGYPSPRHNRLGFSYQEVFLKKPFFFQYGQYDCYQNSNQIFEERVKSGFKEGFLSNFPNQNPNIVNDNTQTFLHYLAMQEYFDENIKNFVDALKGNNAVLDAIDGKGETVLHYIAKHSQDPDFAKEFLGKVDIHKANKTGQTPLSIALDHLTNNHEIDSNLMKLVWLFLEKGASVNTKNRYGLNILSILIDQLDQKLAKFSLGVAKPNDVIEVFKDVLGKESLQKERIEQLAKQHNCEENIQLRTFKQRVTQLSQLSPQEVVKYAQYIMICLERGIDLNNTVYLGIKSYEFLNAAAGFKGVDKADRTRILELLSFLDKKLALQRLIEKYFPFHFTLTEVIKQVQSSIEQGADVDSIDPWGRTALTSLSLSLIEKNPDFDFINFLIKSGADVNYSPLQRSFFSNFLKNYNLDEPKQLQCACLLIQHNADLNTEVALGFVGGIEEKRSGYTLLGELIEKENESTLAELNFVQRVKGFNSHFTPELLIQDLVRSDLKSKFSRLQKKHNEATESKEESSLLVNRAKKKENEFIEPVDSKSAEKLEDIEFSEQKFEKDESKESTLLEIDLEFPETDDSLKTFDESMEKTPSPKNIQLAVDEKIATISGKATSKIERGAVSTSDKASVGRPSRQVSLLGQIYLQLQNLVNAILHFLSRLIYRSH